MLIEKKIHGSAYYDCGINCFCILYSVFISVDAYTSTSVSVPSKWLVMLLDYSLIGCSSVEIDRFTKSKIHEKEVHIRKMLNLAHSIILNH
jgi:hypothetical protein